MSWLFTDHLGSTSLRVAESGGSRLAELRFKGWGATRYTYGSMLTKRQFTGQRNETADIGLYFYNARWYDPVLGRFAQADTVVPEVGNSTALDRYAYTLNNPLNYVDPSGHGRESTDCGPDGIYCGGGLWTHPKYPDQVDFFQLTHANENQPYSGAMMYSLYTEAWIANGGFLTIEQYTIQLLAYEFEPYNEVITAQFKASLKIAAGNWFWCSPNAHTNSCTNLRQNGGATHAAMVNWLASMQSARMRYDAVFRGGADTWQSVFGKPNNLELAEEVFDFVLYESTATGFLPINKPVYWANLSLPLNTDVQKASQGLAFNQYVDVFGPINTDQAFILTSCQVSYWTNDIGYVDRFCR